MAKRGRFGLVSRLLRFVGVTEPANGERNRTRGWLLTRGPR